VPTAEQIDTLARDLLTARQYDAWRLTYNGLSQRNAALALGISRSAVRDRVDTANVKLANALSPQTASNT